MVINRDGNVGIGTNDPSAKLDVNGNVKATSFIGDGSQLTGATGATGPQGPAGPVSSAPTFTNVYVNDWFRNNGINEGLYNQATNSHWYSSGGGQWNLTGGSQTYIFRDYSG